MSTTPIFLLAPTPGMTFVAMPSGATYVADENGLVVVTNGQIADQLALVAAGCATLEPNAGGGVATQTGTAYTVASGDNANNIVFSNASPVIVTLPNALPTGFTVSLYQAGMGQVTAQAATGASIATPNVATTPGPYCALFCIVVANTGGNAAQWAVIAEPSQTGGGVVGATTLASLYTQDTSAHYAQYSVAQIFSDATGANNGFWLKTGTGNGSSNWTQQSTITLASVNAAIAAETGRAEGVEGYLQAYQLDFICPDENYYSGGIFDGSGNPLLGLMTGGGVLGWLVSQTNPPQIDFVCPDDVSTIEGDVGLADPNGNLLFPVPNSLVTSVATAAVNTVVSAAFAAYPSVDFACPDDLLQFQGDIGFADSSGNILNAVTAATITSAVSSAVASIVAAAEASNLPTVDFACPDDANVIAGDIGFADLAVGLLNYELSPSGYSAWNAYVDPTSNGYITAVSPTQSAFPIASARGAYASAPNASIANCDSRPDQKGLLRWTDNGTADGIATRPGGYFTPAVEFREFNFDGAFQVTALGDVSKIVLQIMIGQSLSNGTTAQPFTTSNINNRVFTFNGGPMPYQAFNSSYPAPGALCQDVQLQSLIPLVEIEKPGGINGETYGGGISYWMAQGTNLEGGSVMVYATLGQGGASYSANQMQQYVGATSNSMFASVIRCVERIAAWCKLSGWALEIPCIIHDQGENDYTANPTTYYNDLVANQAAYEVAIDAVFAKFGLTNNGPSGSAYSHIPFLCIQPSSWGFYGDATASAMYEYPELVINNPSKFVLIGPQYWNTNYNPSSGQHMLGIGYRQCAEYAGRAIQRLRDGLASEAVYVTAVSNSGLTLTITFNTQSQLAHDASLVSDPNGQWGIELTANGSNVELLDPAIVGTNQIQFTLASSITGMSCVLGVADVAPSESFGSTSGPTTSARAPIHDSSTDTISTAAGGITMANYACAQQVGFTGA